MKCYKCDEETEEVETLYSELYECCVIYYKCPTMGAEEEETID